MNSRVYFEEKNAKILYANTLTTKSIEENWLKRCLNWLKPDGRMCLNIPLYKDSWKKTSGSKQSDITRDEFIAWTNGVWSFKGESKRKIGHPAPFPVELPRRCIKLFSFVGDTVLDPFMGSGSTVIAAKQNFRNGIGIDIELDYCQLAMERILKETNNETVHLY